MGHGQPVPDLLLQLPSRELAVTTSEVDKRGRRQQAYTTETDYYTRTVRTTVSKYFEASGNLSIAIGKVWEQETVLSARDAAGATLEEQLPFLIHKLEIAEAEAKWSREDEVRGMGARSALSDGKRSRRKRSRS